MVSKTRSSKVSVLPPPVHAGVRVRGQASAAVGQHSQGRAGGQLQQTWTRPGPLGTSPAAAHSVWCGPASLPAPHSCLATGLGHAATADNTHHRAWHGCPELWVVCHWTACQFFTLAEIPLVVLQ